MITKKYRYLFVALILLVLLALACDISVDPGFDLGGNSNENLQATEIALLQTQIAFEQTQQAQAPQQPPAEQPAQPEAQPPADNPPPEPPAQPEQQTTPQGPAPNAVFGDISFYLDPAVAASASHSSEPAVGADDPFGLPAHDKIMFSGYPVALSFHEARILIFPIADYIARNEYAAADRDRLQQLLSSRPNNPGDAPLPFLPFWNAGPLFDAKYAYVDFQNGAGIRYITQHGQAEWPINNHDMFYSFQGITNDGVYYIAAIFPVSHPSLPADGDAAKITDWLAFSENYPTYIANITQQLNAEPETSFTPSLELLDSLFASLKAK